MSGRIRTVKPEWLEDELLAAASDEARVLSVGLILVADDYGNGRASIATIAAEVWRYALERDDGANAPEVLAKASRAFRELLAIGFIGTWTEAGQRYFTIRNWARHQRVDKPGKPLVPKPPADLFAPGIPVKTTDSGIPREPVGTVSGVVPETVRPDLRPVPTTNDQEQEGTVARGRAEAPAPPPEVKVADHEPPSKSPRNPGEAAEMPIIDRASYLEANRHMAEWLSPHTWPEVVTVAQAVHEANGLKGNARLAPYAKDSGVRAVVALYAAGFSVDELLATVRGVTRSKWWRSEDGKPRSLGALSVEVVRREQAGARETRLTPEQQARVDRAKQGLAPDPRRTTAGPALVGAVLPTLSAAGGDS